MRVTVMGAGAVGCYFGALLAQAGHAVTFVGRGEHVAAIDAHGVLLETAAFKGHIPATAVTDAAAAPVAELVLFSVKSADTESAGRAMLPALAPDSAILTLQNGVDNADRLAATIGQAVIPAVVYVGTGMAGPGHVRHFGAGQLVIGPGARSEALAATLTAAGIPTRINPTIESELWRKLITNCAVNALSAIGNLPYGAMLEVEGCPEVVAQIIAECVAVATALGVALPADIAKVPFGVAAGMPGQFSSTAQDLARGKPTEIDFLNGHIVRQGRALGIPTPANLALQVSIHLIEAGRRA